VKALADEKLVRAVLDDWRTAPIDARMHAMLGFLEKLTLTPEAVTPADVVPLRAAGLGDRAIEQAIYVCFLFCTIDRIADAFDFLLPDARSLKWTARILLGPGYKAAVAPGWGSSHQ
jgi:alkylhydroperoxidase family enzyme